MLHRLPHKAKIRWEKQALLLGVCCQLFMYPTRTDSDGIATGQQFLRHFSAGGSAIQQEQELTDKGNFKQSIGNPNKGTVVRAMLVARLPGNIDNGTQYEATVRMEAQQRLPLGPARRRIC